MHNAIQWNHPKIRIRIGEFLNNKLLNKDIYFTLSALVYAVYSFETVILNLFYARWSQLNVF